jgi:hypothetical protein
LFQSDIPDYLRVMRNRLGRSQREMRQFRDIQELTSRLRSSEIPRAIVDLERSAGSSGGSPVDVCLASSIIEVGIDINRLSLMSVVGQPKTTSQYIQVTGRVGRSWWERPGLVVTLYSMSKPRDRSHFEQFRSYHGRLYAQVEPTSVTPFSPPVLDRALHAILCAYVRQRGARNLLPYPFPSDLIQAMKAVLLRRVQMVDPGELDALGKLFDRRAEEWQRWKRIKWGSFGQVDPNALLCPTGTYVAGDQKRLIWATPNSVRNVDAECQAEITQLYIAEEVV